MSARLESRFSWRLLVDTVTDEVSLGEETGAEMAPSTCTFMFEYLVASLSERVKLEPNLTLRLGIFHYNVGLFAVLFVINLLKKDALFHVRSC